MEISCSTCKYYSKSKSKCLYGDKLHDWSSKKCLIVSTTQDDHRYHFLGKKKYKNLSYKFWEPLDSFYDPFYEFFSEKDFNIL